ncbi:MAG: 30S ribosomal protein S16 [Bacteroidales bacterium]|jgi:small subunit ribosomal protein S16|nr:30S ribosomal protein S16 [Bacteroidales bacterium]
MPAKIRLQRHGKKGQPFYHIVVADSRAPRDGKFIEKIGTYNPLTNPAQINIKFDRALYWYSVGAVPTDTTRSLLSKVGVMMKYHLMRGVQKGAMTEEQAEIKFQNWMKEKEARNANIVKADEEKSRNEKKTRMEAEKQINETRAAEIAKRKLAEMEARKAAEAEAAAQAAAEEAAEEAAPQAEATEAPAEA